MKKVCTYLYRYTYVSFIILYTRVFDRPDKFTEELTIQHNNIIVPIPTRRVSISDVYTCIYVFFFFLPPHDAVHYGGGLSVHSYKFAIVETNPVILYKATFFKSTGHRKKKKNTYLRACIFRINNNKKNKILCLYRYR